LEYNLPFDILFGIALSSILSTCPNHLILLSLMHLSLHCILSSTHYFSMTGSYILRIVFISNILTACFLDIFPQ
jgi:hypothetical protein